MKYWNKQWFSLVIALWLTLIMILLVLYILEYMVPYSKNVQWIENSTNAFYQTESAIEDWLYGFKSRGDAITQEWWKNMTSSVVDFSFTTTSSGSVLPTPWYWNSEYNKIYNIISIWNPLQLQLWEWSNIDWRDVDFTFKVPDLSPGNLREESIVWDTLAIINWQLSSESNSLNASWTGSYIQAKDICDGDTPDIFIACYSHMDAREGLDLNWISRTFQNFYDYYCKGAWSEKCTLKMSIINRLDWTAKETGTVRKDILIPYLEYKIDFGSTNVALRYSRIEATGKSYGFQKKLEVRVPQTTTNEAFDFTVFQ